MSETGTHNSWGCRMIKRRHLSRLNRISCIKAMEAAVSQRHILKRPEPVMDSTLDEDCESPLSRKFPRGGKLSRRRCLQPL